ncbi:MAG: ABC transporter permease, partial [Bacteroidota bacterium]
MSKPTFSWLAKMAWRDSRRNRGKLLLFVSSIVVGIAALVAINSFGENLQKDINNEAKSLLASDLLITGQEAPNDSLNLLLESLNAQDSAQTTSFPSFVRFLGSKKSKLMQVTAIKGNFPLYGNIVTYPEESNQSFREGRRALVEDVVMEEFDIEVGDSIKIGKAIFIVEGRIDRVPGRSTIASSFAPLVYIPMSELEATSKFQHGG